jgi:hypothetical protein
MNEQQQTQPLYEPCMCREAVKKVQEVFGISPAVRQHLTNSRVEFLRAVRAIIDQRIDTLLTRRQEGTKITVE